MGGGGGRGGFLFISGYVLDFLCLWCVFLFVRLSYRGNLWPETFQLSRVGSKKEAGWCRREKGSRDGGFRGRAEARVSYADHFTDHDRQVSQLANESLSGYLRISCDASYDFISGGKDALVLAKLAGPDTGWGFFAAASQLYSAWNLAGFGRTARSFHAPMATHYLA